MSDPDTHYWCHECNREVPATLQQDGSVSCNTCSSVFVEIMERDDPRLQPAATQRSTSTTTSAAPASAPAPAMPLPGFFHFGVAGAPAMGNPFGFLHALQASMSPTAQAQSQASPSAQQHHQHPQQPPPFMMFGPQHQHFQFAHPTQQPGQPGQSASQQPAQPHHHHVHMHHMPHHHHHHHVHINAQPAPPPTAPASLDPTAAASGPAVAPSNLPQGQAPPGQAPAGPPAGQPAVNPAAAAQPLWMPFFPPQVQQMMQAMMNGAQLPQGAFRFPGAQGPAPGVVQGDYAFGDIQHIINRLMQQDAGRFGAPPTAEDKLKELDEMTLDHETVQHFTSSCGVCQDDFVEGDKLCLLPCAHYFHSDCCRPWLTQHCTCPICRYNLNTGRIEPDKPRGRR